MKGVILAGGTGTRLGYSARVTNKHLLCVYDRPMIFFPLFTLLNVGIKEIMIVTGKEHMGDMIELLGSGSEFRTSFTYKVQDEAGGIAQALFLAKDFIQKEHCIVILGDNMVEDIIEIGDLRRGEAKVFLKEVDNPRQFGVTAIKRNEITEIIEKPRKPESNLAVTGAYIYDSSVFSIISKLKPSGRGELEITDVNNAYIRRGKMRYSILKGFWSDMGTPDSLIKSSVFVQQRQGK